MNKKEFTVGSVIFLLLITPILAKTVTIGVAPSELKLNGVGDTCFEMSFFNTYGDVDAKYTMTPDGCMAEYLTSYPTDFIVPTGTSLSSPVIRQLCIDGDFTEKKTCYIYLKGYPVDYEAESGTLAIERQVAIKFLIGEGSAISQATTTTTITPTTTTTITPTTTIRSVTTIQSSGSGGGGSRESSYSTITKTITKTTTTTIKTTITAIPVDSGKSPSVFVRSVEDLPKEAITTTTIETESPHVKAGIAGVNPILVAISALIFLVCGVLYYLKEKYLIFGLMFLLLPYGRASDVNVSVIVVPSPPIPPQEMSIAGLIFLIALIGGIMFTAKVWFWSDKELTINRILYGVLAILIFISVLLFLYQMTWGALFH